MDPFRKTLSERLPRLGTAVRYAYAQEHLEAWSFADARNLRDYLDRALGQVDTSNPDRIRSPENHLKDLLGNRFYTARVSGEIASALHAETIAERSPRFGGFADAVLNGGGLGNGMG